MPENIILTINGTKKDLDMDMLSVEIDTNLHLPGMFRCVIKDELDTGNNKLKYIDSDTFKLGAEVKIEIETDEIPDEPNVVKATVIIGEITAVEPVFTQDGVALLVIRGYDRLHRLSRGKKTRTYGDANPNGSGITDDQIINTIVQETDGITGKVVDTSGLSGIKYPYVIQYNQTDLEFLQSRARMYGYQLFVDDKKLNFQKADAHRGAASEKPSTLVWLQNLANFEPRLSLAGQVTEAEVFGWDPGKKTTITSKSTSDTSKTIPQIGLNKKGSALTKEAFKDPAAVVVTNTPVYTIDQSKAIAAAQFASAESEFIEAEGSCRQGDPRLVAGRMVTIEGVGERFSGDYYVTEARHLWEQGTYTVNFGVSGRVPNTISQLLESEAPQPADRVNGVVTAKVVSLEDPEQLGRVQVMYPWLPKYKDADLSSNWARLAAPMAGKERGLLYLPEIDDEVLVAFEQGDMNFPYVVGGLWNNTDKPPKGTKDSSLSSDKKKVDQRIIRSRSGHMVILDDTDGEEQIIIQDKTAKNSITINSKENTMTINVEKDLTIVAKGKATINATDIAEIKSAKDINIECNNFNVKAKANAKLEATANIDLKATGQMNIKGTQATVEGDAMATLKSNTMVQIQSSAVTKVQGTPIMLN